MKISFIIPAYNEEKYITQCLESVVAEAKRSPFEYEIIVVNNASSDKTKEIALSFSEVIVVDEPKRGTSNARQAGLSVSKGDLIVNFDADSIMPQGWSRKIEEIFEDDSIVALSGPCIYHESSIAIRMLVKIYYFFAFLIHTINQDILKVGAVLQGGNAVLRRSALEKIGGYDISIKFYGDDTDIAKRMSKVGRVKFDLSFTMKTSSRRFKKEGLVKIGWNYLVNHLWVIIFGRPFSTEYQEIADE